MGKPPGASSPSAKSTRGSSQGFLSIIFPHRCSQTVPVLSHLSQFPSFFKSLSLKRTGLPKVGIECLETKAHASGTRGSKGKQSLLFASSGASCSLLWLPQPHPCIALFLQVPVPTRLCLNLFCLLCSQWLAAIVTCWCPVDHF